jgi:abortive infection bacteriophage resistance protein
MASRIAYTKQAKSTSDLLAHLNAKGLIAPDRQKALHSLELIGYYRLLIYMRPLQDNRSRLFKSDVEFDDILALYDFDRRLRLICLDAVERIEVAMRAAIASALALDPMAGPHFYLDSAHFTNTQAHASFMRAVIDPITCKHQAVEHYLKTYALPPFPPIWAVLEATTFGLLSHLYASLLLPHRKTIAKAFGFDEKILVTWLKSIHLLRNVCAHHSRLWNKNNLVNAPGIAKSLKAEFPAHVDRGRVAARAVPLVALLAVIDPESDWKQRFKSVLLDAPSTAMSKAGLGMEVMGFSNGWDTRAFWI